MEELKTPEVKNVWTVFKEWAKEKFANNNKELYEKLLEVEKATEEKEIEL